MDIQTIVAQLKQEVGRIEHAISALLGLGSQPARRGRPPKSAQTASAPQKRSMSAAARARIVGYRYGSDVPAFTNEINYRPMLLALLQMPEVQISQLAASKSAPQQDGENRPIPFSFEGVCIWRLPEATGFFGCEPVPKPCTQLLGTFHTSDASHEFRTEQTSVRGFIGEPAYSGESSVDRSPRKLSILKEYAIAGNHNLVERQSWLGAVPLNKFINGVSIPTFGLG